MFCGNVNVKKWLTNITMMCFFLSGGIEYGVILPTCWDYLHVRFGAEEWLYGLTISALSISNFVIGPIMGAIYDRTHQTKLIVLFLNLFEIGGNFMYFAATSKYMVLGSRFIVGIGVSAGAVLFGEISRTSSKRNRTSIFSFFMSARQFGLIIGPGLNLFLRICDFKIGHFVVDKFTSPALFMMSIWILLQFMFLFLFFQLPTGNNDADSSGHTRGDSHQHEIIDDSIKYDDDIKESNPLLTEQKKEELGLGSIDKTTVKGYASINTPPLNSNPVTVETGSITSQVGNKWSNFSWILGEFVTEQITLLLAILFITIFNQLVLESGLVPLVEKFFGWNEFDISLFYSVAGVVLLISFLCVAVCTKFLSDRWLIAFGIACTLLSFIWYIAILGSAKKFSYTLPAFIVGSVIIVFTIPFIFVPAASLYSKYLPLKIQGFGQGIRRSVASLAAIMGPLWAGSGFELAGYAGYYPFFGVPLFLVTLTLILVLISFRHLNYQEPKSQLQADKTVS